MSEQLTVKQLKEFIKDLPDNMLVERGDIDYSYVEVFSVVVEDAKKDLMGNVLKPPFLYLN